MPDAPLEPDEPLEPWVVQSLLSEPDADVLGFDAEVPELDMPPDVEEPLDCCAAQSVLLLEPVVVPIDPEVPVPEAPLEPMPPALDVPLLVLLFVPLAPVLPPPDGHVPEGHDCAEESPACASNKMKSAEENFFMLPPSR